jgi:carbamoylphosphate synthase large subunit
MPKTDAPRPKVLLVSTSFWFSTARLAGALRTAGWLVEGICSESHPLRKTPSVSQTHRYRGLQPLDSLASAIASARPDLILPCDDLAAQHLRDLHAQAANSGHPDSICALIERSIGSHLSFPIIRSRAAFMAAAEVEGIRVPKTKSIESSRDLEHWLRESSLPVVLKADGTSSGEGVIIARSVEEAKHAVATLNAPPLAIIALKRAIVDGDLTQIRPMLLRQRSPVCAQTYISGTESTSLVACWQGQVLAGLHFEVVMKQHAAGPSSVLRLIDDPEMNSAVEKMVRRLDLSGLHGFDFMLEKSSGNAYLIEINPRTTQVGHLTLGAGRDLPAALLAAFRGQRPGMTPSLTDKNTIALFPQEWIRDPSSPYLLCAYHDVPWDEPELVRDGIRRRGKLRAWVSQQKWLRFLAGTRISRP